MLKKRNGEIYLAVIGLGCMIISCFFDITGYFALTHVIYYMPYYIVGMLAKNKKLKCKLIHTIIIGVVYISAFVYKVIFEPKGNLIGYILGFAAVYLIVLLLKNIKLPKYVSHNLEFSGKYSLQYYLLNAFVMTGSRIFTVSILKIKTPEIITILMFAITYIVSYLVSVYIIDSNNVFRIVCGLKPIKGE